MQKRETFWPDPVVTARSRSCDVRSTFRCLLDRGRVSVSEYHVTTVNCDLSSFGTITAADATAAFGRSPVKQISSDLLTYFRRGCSSCAQRSLHHCLLVCLLGRSPSLWYRRSATHLTSRRCLGSAGVRSYRPITNHSIESNLQKWLIARRCLPT